MLVAVVVRGPDTHEIGRGLDGSAVVTAVICVGRLCRVTTFNRTTRALLKEIQQVIRQCCRRAFVFVGQQGDVVRSASTSML